MQQNEIDYSDWVTVATDDDDTPIWSGPRENAEKWLESDQGKSMARALSHQGVKLVTREWKSPGQAI